MKRILTHKKPDLDAIVSAWLAQEYLFAGEECEVVFVGRSITRERIGAADCVVDVGNAYVPDRLWFDHKPPAFSDRNATCATKLVWEYLMSNGRDLLSLLPLVYVTFEGDTRKWSLALKESRKNGPHAALNRFASESNDDYEVYARMVECLRSYASSLPPAFGEWIAEQEYRHRPGAYAVLFDADRRIAVIQTAKGYFLPGGGSETGETPEQTLMREIGEECGFTPCINRQLGEAIEYIYAAEEATYFAKYGCFFTATLSEANRSACEPDHTLLWLLPAQAVEVLTHASQRWAVHRTLKQEPEVKPCSPLNR